MTEDAVNGLDSLLNEIEQFHIRTGIMDQIVEEHKRHLKNEDNELEAICSLIEAHNPELKNKALSNNFKNVTDESINFSDVNGINAESKVPYLLSNIHEMPKEWTVVQLTPQFDPMEYFNENPDIFFTNPLHITVFRCGPNEAKPFTITVDFPKDPTTGEKIELVKEMANFIKTNKSILTSLSEYLVNGFGCTKTSYKTERQALSSKLKSIINDIEKLWLKEWRCLLLGKYQNESLEKYVPDQIRNFFKTNMPNVTLTQKIKMLLSALVKGFSDLTLKEIKEGVKYCFPDVKDKNFIKTVSQFLNNLGMNVAEEPVKKKQKHPLILLLHNNLDLFPWESLDILQNKHVTRLPSFYFLHSLFKEHEASMVDGFKTISDINKGTYIIDPNQDLDKMEIRMTQFFKYWLPTWIGIIGNLLSKEIYNQALVRSEIFSYNGHGSGLQYGSKKKLEQSNVKSVMILSGCGSVQLKRTDPQVEVNGIYNFFLLANSPCVVGTLWEVTDFTTDMLTSDFLSFWIPSKAPVHWKFVDKQKWRLAVDQQVQFLKKKNNIEVPWEPELVAALNLAKQEAKDISHKSAFIARGLPVKIKNINDSS